VPCSARRRNCGPSSATAMRPPCKRHAPTTALWSPRRICPWAAELSTGRLAGGRPAAGRLASQNCQRRNPTRQLGMSAARRRSPNPGWQQQQQQHGPGAGAHPDQTTAPTEEVVRRRGISGRERSRRTRCAARMSTLTAVSGFRNHRPQRVALFNFTWRRDQITGPYYGSRKVSLISSKI